jgi:two-component system, NtrC family, response regulator
VDVRFIFATNKDLRIEVEAGRFSEALFHRLNVFNIPLPSLRERREDIPALVEYFLGPPGTGQSQPRIAQKAMRCLMSYEWRGNVRELQNVLERGMILSEHNLITEKMLPLDLVVDLDQGSSGQPFQTLQEIEREHILIVLGYVNGHKTKAAKLLGISRKTLYRKIQELNLED